MSIEAMKAALEALEKSVATCFDQYAHEQVMSRPEHFINQTFTTLRQAIAEAEKQEPVAWIYKPHRELLWPNEVECTTPIEKNEYAPLYITPQPQREWVGLTDEEIDPGLLRSDYALQTAHAWRAGVVFAMTQLKEKNT